MTIPLDQDFSTYTYQFNIDWGDGTRTSIDSTDSSSPIPVHTYSSPGIYTVSIWGSVPAWSFAKTTDSKDQIIEVVNFGDLGYENLNGGFKDCINLTSFSGGVTTSVTDMEEMFSGTSQPTSVDASTFDVSNVTTLEKMFRDAIVLNSLNTTGWDTSGAINSNDWNLNTLILLAFSVMIQTMEEQGREAQGRCSELTVIKVCFTIIFR